jgi:hypothetical protein
LGHDEFVVLQESRSLDRDRAHRHRPLQRLPVQRLPGQRALARQDGLFRFSQARGEAGEVKKVLIQGKSVSGKLADGNSFRTFTADYPDLIKALKDKASGSPWSRGQ